MQLQDRHEETNLQPGDQLIWSTEYQHLMVSRGGRRLKFMVDPPDDKHPLPGLIDPVAAVSLMLLGTRLRVRRRKEQPTSSKLVIFELCEH